MGWATLIGYIGSGVMGWATLIGYIVCVTGYWVHELHVLIRI
jgi:hypothetical protein